MLKNTTKWIIVILLVNIIVFVIVMPLYKSNIIVGAYEAMLYESIGDAISHYEAYKESGDLNELENMVYDLYRYDKTLRLLEKEKNLIKNSTEVTMAINVIRAKKDDLENEDLYEALTFLQSNIYSDIGYSMLLSFVNKNS